MTARASLSVRHGCWPPPTTPSPPRPQAQARGIYYDAAHSSKTCFQKTSGLRWTCLALLVPVNWAARVWALPFLTALCPSKRYGPYQELGRRHKPLPERARGLLSPSPALAAASGAHRGGR